MHALAPPSHTNSGTAVRLALVAVLAVSLALGWRQIGSPDIGFHLAVGRWIADHAAIPHRDPLAYTLPDRPYVDLQWLYDLAVWRLHAAGGPRALLATNLVLALTAGALLLLRVRRARGRLALVDAALLLPIALGNTWEIRPHIVSWLLLNLVLLALESHRRHPGSGVWWLPALMALWVNVHSLYILGLVAIAAYALPELARGRRADWRLLLAAAAAGAACLANPYGFDALLFPFDQFAMLRPGSVFKGPSGIAEFDSPFRLSSYFANGALVLYQPLLFMQAFAVLALVGVLGAWRRTGWPERLIVLLFAYTFWSARKNFGYFAVATFPVVAWGWSAVWARLPARARPGLRVLGTAGLLLASLMVVLHIRSGYLWALRRVAARPGASFNAERLPVRASAFLNRPEVPPGRLLNHIDDGGYLAFATGRPVFVDGRLERIGAEFYAYCMALQDPDRMGAAILEHDIHMILVPYSYLGRWVQALEGQPAWRCVYADSLHALYFRVDFAPAIPALPPPVPGRDFPTFTPEEAATIVAQAAARRAPGLLRGLSGRHAYPLAEIRRSAFWRARGYPAAALGIGLDGLRHSTFPAPALLGNIGNASADLGLRELAARCQEGARR